MSDLKDRLQSDLTSAMKSRDQLRTATLRMALTAVHVEEVAGDQARQLTDDEVLRVLSREVKKRREAAEAFAGASRQELADRERAESDVLSGYLPAQLEDEELTGLVRDAIVESGVTTAKQMGQVMKLVGPRVAGRAEGGRVAAEVRRQLVG